MLRIEQWQFFQDYWTLQSMDAMDARTLVSRRRGTGIVIGSALAIALGAMSFSHWLVDK